MSVIFKRRNEFTCLKCSHVWTSTKSHPQQCPVCKRKDWDGLHNSMGRLLTAVGDTSVTCPHEGCNHVWSPRKPNPKSCPLCKRYLADVVAAPVTPVNERPAMRGGKIMRECNWCKNTFMDDTRGQHSGICGYCSTDFYTGEDMSPMGYQRWSQERWVIERGRADNRGRVVVQHTALRPVDPFDPDGLLKEREGLL